MGRLIVRLEFDILFIVETGIPHARKGQHSSEAAFLAGRKFSRPALEAVFHNGTDDPRTARGRGVAIVTDGTRLPAREISRDRVGRCMAATIECAVEGEGGGRQANFRVMAGYPPSGGTAREARGKPGFAKAEDALADFALAEHAEAVFSGLQEAEMADLRGL